MFSSYASAPAQLLRVHTQNITSICLTSQPLTVECRRGHPASSVRDDTLTHCEPSASEQNTGYTTRGCGCGCRRGRGRRRAEAAHKHQAEVAALKLVQARPHNRLIEVGGPCPFSRTLLRDPLVHSDFSLDSITCTIIEIKT